MFIQPNRGQDKASGSACYVKVVSLIRYKVPTADKQRTFYFQPLFKVLSSSSNAVYQKAKVPCQISPYQLKGQTNFTIGIVDYASENNTKALQQYAVY